MNNQFINVVRCLIFSGTMIFLAACSSQEERVINRLDNLANRVEKNADGFDSDDWADVMKEFEEIHKSMGECDFSKEELKEVGKKEGRLSAILAKEGSKALGNGLKSFMGNLGSFADGFTEGVGSEVNDDDLKGISEDIEDVGDEIEKELNGILDGLGD